MGSPPRAVLWRPGRTVSTPRRARAAAFSYPGS